MSHRCLHFEAPAFFCLHLRSISGASGQQPNLFSGPYPQRPAGIALPQAPMVPWTTRFGQCWTTGSFRFCGQISCTWGWRFDPVGPFLFPPLLADRSRGMPIIIQLSMWNLTIRDANYCPRHEGRRPMLDGRAVSSVGTQGYARRVLLCQGKEQLGWSQHVVCHPSLSDPVVRLTIILPSLIYQLLDYERALKSGGANSPTFSDRSSIVAAEEEEWGRRRSMLDNDPSDADVEEDRDVTEVAREARALDKAMEDRVLARKSSSSSIASSGLGMGVAWKSRYGGRRRTGSIASNITNASILSEDLVEEDEEEELLNVGGGFDNDSRESDATSPDSQYEEEGVNKLPFVPQTARPTVQRNPPPGPTSSHKFPRIPTSTIQATFDLPPLPRPRLSLKGRRRPPPLSILPTVPSSPINPGVMKSGPPQRTQSFTASRISAPALPPSRQTPPKPAAPSQPVPTPSQTLFVFPPSPDALPSAAPSTMILTPSMNTLAFPSMRTPRMSMRGSRGRPQSFIAQATPTTAFSLVDVRGWVGMK